MPFTFNIAPCPGWHLWWWISMYFCLLPYSLHPLSFHVLLPLGSIHVLTYLSSPWFLLVNQADNFFHCQVDKQSLFIECRQLCHLGLIHTISDSSRTSFLTRSDIKILHCSHYSAPLHSRHLAVCLEDLFMATLIAWKLIDARKQSWLQLKESFRSDNVFDSWIHTRSKMIRYRK